jgi:hypothetical protein
MSFRRSSPRQDVRYMRLPSRGAAILPAILAPILPAWVSPAFCGTYIAAL